MIIEIDTSKNTKIDWSAKDAKRIAQNVTNLISTWKYEVAYDRIKGMDASILDKPADEAATLYSADVYRVVAEYEPRAKVLDVNVHGVDNEGNILARVVIEI